MGSARLSTPIADIRDHYTVVVVGSGYGGAISASRLARAGQNVCLLERGREIQPGEYPDALLETAAEMQVDSPGGHVGSRTGLFDFHFNDDLNVLVGCGLGGTSLINANVALEAEPRVFEDPRWPQELRDDLPTLIEEGYRRAREMLGSTPYPEHYPPLRKLAALEQSALRVGARFYRPPLNVTFEDGPNHAGVEQQACTLCGDCVTGCNYRAKNTTLMNYLPDARAHGAEIFTQTSVRSLERKGDRWVVHFQLLESGRERFDAPTLFVTADVVVLGAGTLGSTEILLRSKDAGLALSDRLGERFTGNGDVLGFGYNGDVPIDGVGFGSMPADEREPVGPTITGIGDLRGQPVLEDGMVIEDGAVPSALGFSMPAFYAAAAKLLGRDTDAGAADAVEEASREVESLLRGPYHGASRNTQTYLVMSHDDGGGRLHLDEDRLRVAWPGVGRQANFRSVDATLDRATATQGGTYLKNPMWSKLTNQDLISVHPLGGCSIGSSASEGVVNHRGQVFSGETGTAVHDGLFVADGSVVPRPLGVNPLLTISALAERTCALLAKERGWTIDYAPATAPLPPAEPRRTGIRFTEQMQGFFSTAVTDDYERAARRGRDDDSRLKFTVSIISDDLEAMLGEESHGAKLIGTVEAAALSPEPLSVSEGVFNLFVEDPDHVGTRLMRYRMRLSSEEGRHFLLDGFKAVRDDPGLADPWTDTTTLFTTVYEGEGPEAPIVGRGILRIAVRDLIRQLRTIEVTNAPSRRERLAAVARFGLAFAGTVYDVYGGIFARSSPFEPEAPPRKRRPLRTDEPVEVEEVETGDGARIRLTRYRGGEKGPVIAAHGLGTSSSVFEVDTIDTNLLEYLYLHGYDVWLLDWRASPELPGSQGEFTLDDVARYDWPAAVAHVLAATGSPSVQIVADGVGSMAFFAAVLSGLDRVGSAVSLQLATDMAVPRLGRVTRGFAARARRAGRGTSIEASLERADRIGDRLADSLLRLQPLQKEERCTSRACRRATFVYGLLYEHEQLNRATHDAVHELVGLPSPSLMRHLLRIARTGSLVSADGEDVYLPNLDRLAFPIAFLHGAENEVFLPRGTETTYDRLRARFGKELYSYHPIPGYGHVDCLIGRNAVLDVYPLVLAQLERTLPEPAGAALEAAPTRN